MKRRLHRIPAFRWRYLPSPLGLGYPLWVDDPDFNLDYHLRHVACPAPGDQRALCRFMSSAKITTMLGRVDSAIATAAIMNTASTISFFISFLPFKH